MATLLKAISFQHCQLILIEIANIYPIISDHLNSIQTETLYIVIQANIVYWTPGLTIASFAENDLKEEIEKREEERGEKLPKRW